MLNDQTDYGKMLFPFALMARSKGSMLSDKQIEARCMSYFEGLKDFDADVDMVIAALDHIRDNDKSFPTIQDIKDRIRKIEGDRNKMHPQDKEGRRQIGCSKCSMGNVRVYTKHIHKSGQREQRVFLCGHCHKGQTGGTPYMIQHENKIYDVSVRHGELFKAAGKPALVIGLEPVTTSEDLAHNFEEGFIHAPDAKIGGRLCQMVRGAERENKRIEVINNA